MANCVFVIGPDGKPVVECDAVEDQLAAFKAVQEHPDLVIRLASVGADATVSPAVVEEDEEESLVLENGDLGDGDPDDLDGDDEEEKFDGQ